MPVDLKPEKEIGSRAQLTLLQTLRIVGVLDAGRSSELASRFEEETTLESASQPETLSWLLREGVIGRSDLETLHLFATNLAQAIEEVESKQQVAHSSPSLQEPGQAFSDSDAESTEPSFESITPNKSEDIGAPQRMPFSMAAKPGELDALQAGLSDAAEHRRSHRRKTHRRREREEILDEHEWKKPWQLTFKENVFTFLRQAVEESRVFSSLAIEKMRSNPRNTAIAAATSCVLLLGSWWLFFSPEETVLPEQSASTQVERSSSPQEASTLQASPLQASQIETKAVRTELKAASLDENTRDLDKAPVQLPKAEPPPETKATPTHSADSEALGNFAKLAEAGAYDQSMKELNRLRSDTSISMPKSDINLLGCATLLAQGGSEAYRKTGNYLLANVELESRLWATVFGAWLIHSDPSERQAATKALQSASTEPVASKMEYWIMARDRDKRAAAYLESLSAAEVEPADLLFRAMAHMEAGERARALQDLSTLNDLQSVIRGESNLPRTAEALGRQLCSVPMRRAAETVFSHLTGNKL